VIQVAGFDEHIADAKESFSQFRVVDPARKVLELYRKIRVLHLASDRILEAALKSNGGANVELESRKESRRKKRKALDVIPMSVADQKMNTADFSFRVQQLHSQFTNARAAIQDDDGVITWPDFDARRIPAIKSRALSRRWDGTTGSPKANAHQLVTINCFVRSALRN
jgi:hypothetical protein